MNKPDTAHGYNPDVLTCLANLSNDEVFTPPLLANKVLDMLPSSIWRDKKAKFLDPVSKTGVFLREITKRLIEGLESQIPDLQKRIDHILKNQVFGIAITELTALLSRRSLYCSKCADGKYSISTSFKKPEGNILFARTEHTWEGGGGKCVFCGASQEIYDREEVLETHAYQFIHTEKPEEVFGVKFDVIVGNPPYQMSTSGSVQSQATPIYNKFVEQAKKLNPRYLTMIIPARWYSGGFGLDKFRNDMLNDNQIRIICDYFDSNDCFPGIDLSGGVCYFLWERGNPGTCSITTRFNGKTSTLIRPLLEDNTTTFVRFNEAVGIIKKITEKQEPTFTDIVSPRDPFGLNYYENGREIMFKKVNDVSSVDSVAIYSFRWQKDGVKYIDKHSITTRTDLIDKYKIFISKAYGERGSFPYLVIGKPFIGEPNTCCNMTYLTIGEYPDKKTAKNVISYMNTRFFRFLVLQLKNTQNAYRQVYSFVPIQDFSKSWTDEELYKKYGLTEEEIAFIESMIRPMTSEEE